MIECLDHACPQVGVEDAIAPPRLRGGARGEPVDEALEGLSDRRELPAMERAPRRREEAQHAPALRCPARETRQDELLEAGAERDAGQLPSRRENLLGDERIAAGAFGHEQEGRRGGALALDLRDELSEVESVERAELQP